MELDVRHLRLVAAVADRGTVAAAARHLGAAQPTVIVQLRRIEAAVGRELFLRGPDGMRPTDAGRRLLRHARGVLDGIGRMAEESARTGPGDVVRVIATGPLDGVLPALHRRRPDDRWVVSRSTPEGCRAAVREGVAHLALVLRHEGDAEAGSLADAGLVVHVGPSRHLHLLVAATHPRAADPLVDLRELADDRWVTGVGRYDPVLRECRAAGVEPDVAFRVDDRETAQRIVADGLAVTIAPRTGPAPGVVAVPYRAAGAATWLVLTTDASGDLAEDALAALRSADPARPGAGP